MIADPLFLDLESKSAAPIKKTGTHGYAEHPTTDLLCVGYAFGDGPVRMWRPGQPVPADVYEHIMLGLPVVAHKEVFERLMLSGPAGQRHGWPALLLRQMICSMTMALVMALPAKLEMLAPALGIKERKDPRGKSLLKKLSRPRAKRKGDPTVRFWTRDEKPADFQALEEYCAQDIETMRAAYKQMRPLTREQRDAFERDAIMNDRGVRVDVPALRAAQRVVDAEAIRLDAEMRRITGGVVKKAKSPKLCAWLTAQGCPTTSVKASVVTDLLQLGVHITEAHYARRTFAKLVPSSIEELIGA